MVRWGLAGLGLLLMGAAQGQAPPPTPETRALFQKTLAEVRAGRPLQLPAVLRDYPLRPYLEAVDAQQRISRSDDSAESGWRQFVERYPDHPMRRDVERAWWRELGRREQWTALLTAMPEPPDVAEFRCLALRARIELRPDDPTLVPAVQAVFLTGSALPEACTKPLEWLRDRGQRSPSLVRQRVQLALEAKEWEVVRYAITLLPEAQRAEPQRSLRLRTEPASAIPALVANPPAEPPFDDLIEGWRGWVRADMDQAARWVDRVIAMPGLTPQQRQQMLGELGLRFSWSRRPEAMTYFRRAANAYDERVYTWRIRAALWSNDWPRALTWINELPGDLALQPRWRYWRARALAATGQVETARSLYQGLLGANNVYAQFAAWQLGERITPEPRPGAAADPARQAALAREPALQRMSELHALGLRDWFNLEWFAFLRDRDAAFADQLSHYAFAQGWRLHGVAAATRASLFDDFERLFPRPFETPVLLAASDTGVPPALINGLIRQESLYDTRAVSRANAFGLMQLLLPTAEAVARRHQLPRPTRESLFRPEVNIPLGARYLMEMRDRHGGQWVPAIGSYNAGPGAVARWLPEAPMAPDIWIENIPFNETREYIGKLLWHHTVYAWLMTGEPQRPDRLLAPVVKPGV